jgi:deaminated glutathione amidase
VLPEKWNVLGEGDVLEAGAEPLDGPSAQAAASWARELGVDLIAGSIAERDAGSGRLHNTSLHFDPRGERVAFYRKIHMFDVEVGGVSYRESEHEDAGEEITVSRAGEVEIGLTVCYDLRFPELYRILALEGARIVTVPSAFTEITGRDHWHVLVRARAIENQLFVVAANQAGDAPPHYRSYGHSLIADPWGRVLAEAPGEGERFLAADLDLGELDRIRAELPSLQNRRPGAYRWPELQMAVS